MLGLIELLAALAIPLVWGLLELRSLKRDKAERSEAAPRPAPDRPADGAP